MKESCFLKKLFSKTEVLKKERTYTVFNILGIKITKRIAQGSIFLIKGKKRIKVKKIKGLEIRFYGRGAVVEIENPHPKFVNCTFKCFENSYIKIGSSPYAFQGLNICNNENCKISFGRNVSIDNGGSIINREPDISVSIGDDCMFSQNTYIRPCDGHTIYDSETNKVLNHAKDIVIGNHVWIGYNVKILKGSKIPNNFVIGTSSIVTHSSISSTDNYKKGGILIGSPAKVFKTGINWSRARIVEFEQQKSR